MKNLSLVILSIFFTISLQAQEPFDCITAYNVCGGETTTFTFDAAKGTINEEIPESCFNSGSIPIDWTKNSVWLKYKFKKDGKFTFTIHPLDDQQDIDFLIVQSKNNDCTDFSVVRCMSSGEGLSKPDSPCLGDTGLKATSKDESEGPGCYEGFDNFLAPIDVKENDIYYLYINNFQTNKLNFSIIYDNPDLLGCAVATKDIPNIDIEINPNPTSNYLSISSSYNQVVNYQILDSTGKRIENGTFKNNKVIDTSKMINGLYFIRFVTSQSSILTKKILIQK